MKASPTPAAIPTEEWLIRAGGVRTVRLAASIVLAGTLLYLLLIPAPTGLGDHRVIGASLLVPVSLSSLILLQLGRPVGAYMALLCGVLLAITASAILVAGLRSALIFAYPAVIVGAMALGLRMIYVFGAAAIAGVVGIALADHFSLLPPPKLTPPAILGVVYVLVLLVLTAVVASMAREQRRWQTKEQIARLELEDSVQLLAKRERELRLVTENVPAMICAYEGMTCRYANPRYAEFFGFTPASIVGRHLREIVGEAAFEHARPLVERTLAGEQVSYRGRRASPAFGERAMEIKLVPTHPEPGRGRGFYGLFFDVTEQEQAAEAIRAREAWLRLAGESAQVGLWDWDVATDKLQWNDGLKAIFGLPPDTENLNLPTFLAAIHPDDLEETRHSFMAALGNRSEFDHEYRIVRPDGAIRWIVARGLGEYGQDGKPLRMTGAALDITERKRVEDKFSKVFHASPVPISISRLDDGLYLDANEAFIEQFGWSKSEIIGRSSVEIGIWPSAAERTLWSARLRASGRVKSYEATLNVKSGERRSVLISAEQFDLEGEKCVIGMIYDITERRRTEAALGESEARLKEAQRIGHFGSWDLDLASKRLQWTDELFDIYGCDPDAFGGTWDDLLERIHPDDRLAIHRVFRESANGGKPYEIDHRIITPDGAVKHLHVRWEVFRDGNGKPVRALGTAQDITAQVLATEEIQRLNTELERRVVERTADLTSANRELESFAYSISHDLRAPLRGIDGFSQLLLEEYQDKLDATGRGYLDRVRRAAQRMGTLIDDILELSRVTRHSMRRTHVDLSQLAREILDELAHGAPGCAIEASIAPDCTAFGDPQLLRVLMQNLLENAWKYSGRQAAPKIAFGRETADGEAVFFVRDNGVGFDMKYAGRLFTPFQRLHKPEEFEGTGIGLATVARIVQRHGGRVWAEAVPGQGATLRFVVGGGKDA